MLAGASLVQPERLSRYKVHDLLRAYALDQAREVDSEEERRETVDRISRWYIATAFSASKVLMPGRAFPLAASAIEGAEPASLGTPAAALEWLDAERPSLVANAQCALETGLPRRAWELAMVLGPVHASYLMFDDWSVLSEVAVSAAGEIDDPAALASALDNRGRFLFRRGALLDAKDAHARALEIQEDAGDEAGILRSLNALGLLCFTRRELAEATDYFTCIVDRARATGEPRWDGTARVNLAHTLLEAGRTARAMEILAPLPEFFARRRDQLNEGTALHLIALAHRALGDPAAALAPIDAALRIAETAGSRGWEAHWLVEAARVHLALGQLPEAMRCCETAVSAQRQIGDRGREAAALDCTGEVWLAMGNAENASAFHRMAAQMQHIRADDWQEALALIHLADSEAALGQDDNSHTEAARALALIERFTDDHAVEVRERLRQTMA
jgi:tetratricopeptide (TPR) repeat protein